MNMILPELFTNLGHQLGLFAIVIVVLTALSRGTEGLPAPARQALLGLVFGAGAIFGMNDPVTLAPGVIVDARNVMIALSGPYVGPVGAIVAAGSAGAYRSWLGGAGATAGLVSTIGVGLGSIAVARLRMPAGRGFDVRNLVILASVTSIVGTLALLLLPPDLHVPERLAVPLASTTIVGILVMGLILGEERRHRELQREFVASLVHQRQLGEQHRVITDNVADGIVTFDQDGTIQTFNTSAEWLFGFAAEEVIGKHVAVLTSGPNIGDESTRIRQYTTGREQMIGAGGEAIGRRKDGWTFPMELRVAEFSREGRRYVTATMRDVTRHKAEAIQRDQAEAKLRASEARFRDCAEASSDFLWETDPEHKYTSWEGGSLTSYVDRGLIGQYRWEVAGADLGEEPWPFHLASLGRQQPFKNFVFSMVRQDGEVRWIRSSGKPFYAEDGRFAGYRGASSDITEAVSSQQELQARAQQQQALALLGQLALQEGDPARLYNATCEILVRTLDIAFVAIFEKAPHADELILKAGIGWEPDVLAGCSLPCDRTTLTGVAFLDDEPIRIEDVRLDGRIGPCPMSARYGLLSGMGAGIGDASRRLGAVTVCGTEPRAYRPEEASFLQALAFILGAALDRRNTEASLKIRDRALEAIGQGLIISDATKRGSPVVYVNPSFRRSAGLDLVELEGRSVTDLFYSEDNPGLREAIRRDLKRDGIFSGRMLTRRQGGKRFWDDVTISNVYDETGTLTHRVAVQTDVTQRVTMEGQLREAQKMDAVGKLTGGVAHDFNNLLTVILGNAELMVDALSDPQLRTTAEMILDAAERGSDLVQRLLAFGRRQALQPELFAIDDAVENLAGLLRRTIGEGIVLRTELGCRACMAYVDRSHLDTAILNLATNARDAMPGGGTLTLRTRPVEVGPEQASLGLEPGPYLALAITDTGSGMAPEIKEKAFEPFFTTKALGKGTGLGLSTVYGFVQQSGGHVRIGTALGHGTTVEILLPQVAGAIEAAPAAASISARTGGERVLAVEDRDDVRAFVTAQLASLGYDVVSVSNGPAAIELLRHDRGIQLLFSDILLPDGLDGIELAESALTFRPDLKILFTSGYSDYAVERRSRLLESGVPLLKKPYRRLELASAVREALERHG